jgi:outer membrane lipoprotein-sorting protein
MTDVTRRLSRSAAAASLVLLAPCAAVAQTPAELLRRVDANMTITTAHARAEMVIRYRGGDVRTLRYESWARGTDEAFLEFTAPARDAGSRFLRLGDAMWIFLPRVGKSVRIQGHMLRQGFMGSDFSYGDASENPSMVNDYDAVIERRDTVDGRPTMVLTLTARRANLSYPRRRTWVDVERWVPLREELFAGSGRLLKTVALSDVRRLGDRWYPFRMELDDALQTETTTTFRVLEMRLGVAVPPEVFTLRYLEGGR